MFKPPTEHCEFKLDAKRGGYFCGCGAGSVGLPDPPTAWRCPLVSPPGRPDLDDQAVERAQRFNNLDEATACVHRGLSIREVDCRACGSRGDLFDVFRCNNPNVPEVDCTPTIRGKDAKGVAVCLGCDHQQHPDDEVSA